MHLFCHLQDGFKGWALLWIHVFWVHVIVHHYIYFTGESSFFKSTYNKKKHFWCHHKREYSNCKYNYDLPSPFFAGLYSEVGHIDLYKIKGHNRVCTGLKSTWINRTVLKSPWKLNLPWKVLEKHSKALKSPWILLFTGGFNTVFGDLNHYKIVVPLFGAAYAAPNKGTTILY